LYILGGMGFVILLILATFWAIKYFKRQRRVNIPAFVDNPLNPFHGQGDLLIEQGEEPTNPTGK